MGCRLVSCCHLPQGTMLFIWVKVLTDTSSFSLCLPLHCWKWTSLNTAFCWSSDLPGCYSLESKHNPSVKSERSGCFCLLAAKHVCSKPGLQLTRQLFSYTPKIISCVTYIDKQCCLDQLGV